MKLKANLGPTEQLLRLVLGVVLLNLVATETGPVLIVGLIAGLFGLTTGLTGFCPTYSVIRPRSLDDDPGVRGTR